MTLAMDTNSILETIGAAQAMFAAALLVALHRQAGPAGKWLAIFLFVYGAGFAADLISDHSRLIGLASLLFLGPIAYRLTLAMTRSQQRARLETLAVVLGLVFIAAEFFAAVYAYLVTFLFIGLGLLRLHQYRDRIRNELSDIEGRQLLWLRHLLLVLLGVWLIYFISEAIPGEGVLSRMLEPLFTLVEIIALNALTFYGVRQRQVPAVADEPAAAYARSALDEERMQDIASRIDDAMERERLYERSDLTLSMLARTVGVRADYVSQTMSRHLDNRFYDYVSDRRIEAARERLNDAANKQTILEIALGVGFNSKSTFNAAFKKRTGVTPSTYREQRGQQPK